MIKKKYQIRYAAGNYWLLDMDQDGLDFKAPLSLNETGMYIYSQLCEDKSIQQIAEFMHNEFGISIHEAENDIEDFIELLMKKGIIREG